MIPGTPRALRGAGFRSEAKGHPDISRMPYPASMVQKPSAALARRRAWFPVLEFGVVRRRSRPLHPHPTPLRLLDIPRSTVSDSAARRADPLPWVQISRHRRFHRSE